MTKKEVRLFTALFWPYIILGVINNYMRLNVPGTPLYQICLAGGMGMMIILSLFCLWIFFRTKGGPDLLGITLGIRSIVPIAICVGVLVWKTIVGAESTSSTIDETSIAALGATLEELIFRALLLNVLMIRFADSLDFAGAILISSVFWGIAHFPHGVNFAIQLMFFGAVLAAIYYWTQSTVVGIVVHVLANAGLTSAYIAFAAYLIVAAAVRFRSSRVHALANS